MSQFARFSGRIQLDCTNRGVAQAYSSHPYIAIFSVHGPEGVWSKIFAHTVRALCITTLLVLGPLFINLATMQPNLLYLTYCTFVLSPRSKLLFALSQGLMVYNHVQCTCFWYSWQNCVHFCTVEATVTMQTRVSTGSNSLCKSPIVSSYWGRV